MKPHTCFKANRLRGSANVGFTLVEIMIAVVIIGLLAAMAIPGFNLVRSRTYRFLMNNDARQLAGAAQQYITEYTENMQVAILVDTQTGLIDGPLATYVKKITRGTEVGNYDGSVGADGVVFTMTNMFVDNGAVKSYDNVGKLVE